MASSRRSALLVRAASRRLLNLEEGCPPNPKYVVRELLVLHELESQDAQELARQMLLIDATTAQLITVGVKRQLHTEFWEQGRQRAILLWRHLGHLLSPWDEGWKELVAQSQRLLRGEDQRIGDYRATPDEMVGWIALYEARKAEWEREHGQQSG